MTGYLAFVRVDYSFREDFHIFTSADVPGLYVASKDAEEAFKDLPASIELLAKLNDEVDCSVQPVLSYAEFVETMKADESGDRKENIPHPATTIRQQPFLVTERAA